ncbi:hypothetical protein JMG10_13495 [Nostoc ellipsosporum NOK]|nr:hypothetical protein [Nostoc ellipsosporum NOK]
MQDYRRLFFRFMLVTVILFAIIALAVFQFQPEIFPDYFQEQSTRKLVFYIYLGIGFGYGMFIKKQRDKLVALPAIEERIAGHKKYYLTKIIGSSAIAMLAVLFFMITLRYLYLYLGIFQLLWMITNYPFRFIFRKELNESNLLFA